MRDPSDHVFQARTRVSRVLPMEYDTIAAYPYADRSPIRSAGRSDASCTVPDS